MYFVFTQIIITGTDYQFKKNTVSYIILLLWNVLGYCRNLGFLRYDEYCVLIKTHMGKSLFSPELKSYSSRSETARLLVRAVVKKRTNGSAAELHEPMATIPARSAKMGGASGYISGRFAIGSSGYFDWSDNWVVQLPARQSTQYSSVSQGTGLRQ